MTNAPRGRVDVVVLWGWTVLLALVAVWIVITGGPLGDGGASDTIGFLLVVMVPTVMGALLRTKVPDNPIWLLFIIAGSGALLAATASMLVESGPPVNPAFWDYAAIWFSLGLSSLGFFYPYLLLLYLFPTGRFLNRRWRWAGWYGLVAGPMLALTAAFQTHIEDPFAEEPWSIPNPIGFIPTPVGDWIFGIAINGLYIVALGSVPAIVVRFRRAAADERAQIKWLLFAGALFVVGFFDVVFEFTGGFAAIAGIMAIPVAITIAITRYRLFEIDRIISRTVSYLIVVGLLAVVFVVGAVWLPTRVFGQQSSLFVAGSTLAVVAIFNPMRKRVQRFIDRRFNRSAYKAQDVAARFAGELQQTLTVEELADVWAGTVETSLQPRSMGVWLRAEEGRPRSRNGSGTVMRHPRPIVEKGEEDDRS